MATKAEIRALEENRAWREIADTLLEQIAAQKDQLVEIDPITDATKLARLQGEIMGRESVLNTLIALKEESEEAQHGHQ